MELYMNADVAQEHARAASSVPPYQHGNIGRAEVEQIMRDNGYSEGLYLLRESAKVPNGFVLSVIAAGRLEHYPVRRRPDGNYGIDDGPGFPQIDSMIQYYHKPDARLPTVLKNFCSNAPVQATPGQSYEAMWDAQNTVQATISTQQQGMLSQQPMLSTQQQPMLSQPPVQQVAAPVVLEPGTPYATSDMAAALPETDFGTPLPLATPQQRAPASAPSSSFSKPPGSGYSQQSAVSTSGGSSGDFTSLPSVQETMNLKQQALSQKLNVQEDKRAGYSDQGSERAARHEAKFAEAARREEQMYVMWLNNKLADSGKAVEDLGPSLKDGTLIMQVLSKIGKLPAPNYAKRPRVKAQEIDNWEIIIKYMRKLGMPVDNTPGMPVDEDSVGLDAGKLHEGDRREILKLFGKLLIYEAHNP
eukprot:m.11511 g.11511  ORF g.11511 m.11511 type:complete len:416 (+) comp5737_c0_seq1:27-1274(+)